MHNCSAWGYICRTAGCSPANMCRVHIWYRDSGPLLAQLQGPSGTVTSISWNPTNTLTEACVGMSSRECVVLLRLWLCCRTAGCTSGTGTAGTCWRSWRATLGR